MALNGDTLVDIITASIDIVTTATTDTTTVDFVSTSKNQKSLQTVKAIIFYEDNVDLMDDLQDWLWQVTINTKFDISIKYSDTDTRIATVRIISSSQHIENGIPIGFDMTLVKAS